MFCFVDFIWGEGVFFLGGGGIALFKRFRKNVKNLFNFC